MMENNDDVLQALGLKKGVLYSVVTVGCRQRDCIYYFDCQDNAIGLTDDSNGNFMICHDYKTDLLHEGSDKRVFWERKQP